MFLKHLQCAMHSDARLAGKGTVLATLKDIIITQKVITYSGPALCQALSHMLCGHYLF